MVSLSERAGIPLALLFDRRIHHMVIFWHVPIQVAPDQGVEVATALECHRCHQPR